MKMIKIMSRKIVRKTIEMLQALADESYVFEDEDEEAGAEKENQDEEEDVVESDEAEEQEDSDEVDKYNIFWKNFGKNIKLGVIED
jgi:heat shock protein beta